MKQPKPQRLSAEPEPNPVEQLMDDLARENPRLRVARDAIRREAQLTEDFAGAALCAFRQRFGV